MNNNCEIQGYEVVRYWVIVYDKAESTSLNPKYHSYPQGTEEDALDTYQKYTNLGHKCTMVKVEEAIIE